MIMKSTSSNILSFVGHQSLIELYGCNAALINDDVFVEQTLLKAAKLASLSVVNSTIHHFSPVGVSGVIVIEESHIAIHTWPEYQYVALDFFTCNQEYDLAQAISFLQKAFQSNQVEQQKIQRGSINKMNQFAKKND